MGSTFAKHRDRSEADIFERVEDAHERIEGLLEFLGDVLGPARVRFRERHRKLLVRVGRELGDEQRAEEQSLYSRLHPGDSRVRQALSQHRYLDRLLEELASLDPFSKQWEQRAWSLRWTLEIHFQYEEDEIFELARAELDAADAQELGAAFPRAATRVADARK